jgi:hypothetical protein
MIRCWTDGEDHQYLEETGTNGVLLFVEILFIRQNLVIACWLVLPETLSFNYKDHGKTGRTKNQCQRFSKWHESKQLTNVCFRYSSRN